MISNGRQRAHCAANDLRPELVKSPVEARQLSRQMNGVLILDRIDVTISSGEIVAIVGGNGTGKTTLMRCLVGQLRPNRGEVLWFGASPSRRPSSHRLVGYAAHESCLYSELTATENLIFAARMYGVSQPARRVAELLNRIGLAPWANQAAGRLSKGMRQRLSLARACIHEPPILILDEPFAGLDAASREWLEEWLIERRDLDRAICFSSHDAEQYRRLADRVLQLRDGKLITMKME